MTARIAPSLATAALVFAAVGTTPIASAQSIPQTTATGPGPTTAALNGDNAIIVLQPKSVLTRPLATIGGRPNPMEVAVKFTGEAVFEVRARMLSVETPAGIVMLLMPGRYAIRCTDPCTEVQVTVAQGAATFRGATPSVMMTSGKYGHMTSAGAELTAGAGYPTVPAAAAANASRDTTASENGSVAAPRPLTPSKPRSSP